MKNRAHVAGTDHILRETIFNFLLENPEKVNGNSKNEKIVKTLKTILHNLFELTVREFYPVSETFQLYSMIFDMVTLKTAEEIFSILDDWHEFFKKDEKNRKEFFPAHAKKCTLRLCNDLLRRSSTTGSRDIKFSRKVQLFLAQIFPIDEKSGLNLPSNFNLENTTDFVKEEDTVLTKEDEMDTSASTTEDTSTVNYKIYKSIWSLQKYFNNPCLLFSLSEWVEFEKNSDFVLNLFLNFQIEDNWNNVEPNEALDTQNINFPKYLTSEQLTHLQIKDPSFRRQYIIQILIILQYISSPPSRGPKLDTVSSNRTSSRQKQWISKSNKIIDEILSKSSMKTKEFNYQIIQHEIGWNNWKDRSCPSMNLSSKPKYQSIDQEKIDKNRTERRKRTIDRTNKLVALAKKMKSEEDEIDKKYGKNANPNVTSSYMQFIKNEKYDDVPTPKEFFEQEYQVDNPVWRYKAIRLLAQRSAIFWANKDRSMTFRSLQEYLKLVKNQIKDEVATWADGDAGEEDDQNEIKESEDEEDEKEKAKEDDDNNNKMEDSVRSLEDGEIKSRQPSTKQEKIAPELEKVSDKDLEKLYKLLKSKDFEHRGWQKMCMVCYKLPSSDVRDIASDDAEGFTRFKMMWTAFENKCEEDGQLENLRRIYLHEKLVKYSGKISTVVFEKDRYNWF